MELTRHVTSLAIVVCAIMTTARSAAENGSSSLPVVAQSEERRLINDLLRRYEAIGKDARPVRNASDSVMVQFGIRLVHLDIDEKEQLMKTSCWSRVRWFDDYLMWDPQKYGDVTHITIPADKIWTPDISLVNTGETEVRQHGSHVSVKYSGKVFWAPQRKFSSACLIDVTEYPYDRHKCDMWFQSISNYYWNLNITPYYKSPLDLDTYLTSYKFSQEWNIISNTSLSLDRPRDVGMILMYSRRVALRFSLTIQRRPGFKAVLLIIPCALMSFLFPLIFFFPPERPDRHTLAMSLFASLTIMLFMVNETAPPSAAFVPRLTLYYCFTLLVLLVATLCSVVVVNLSKRGESRERVPGWVRKVFITFLGKVLCLCKRIEHVREVKRASRIIQLRKSQRERQPQGEALRTNGDVTEHVSSHSVPDVNQSAQTTDTLQAQPSTDNSIIVVMNRKLSEIESKLGKTADDVDELPDITAPLDLHLEWHLLSEVLDRLFFVLFLVISCVSFAVFQPRYVK